MGIWDGSKYVIKQKVLTIGRKYYIENESGQQIGFCKQKMFKWKEDIRVYTGEDMKVELLSIQQEQVLDFSGTFRVTDSIKRKHVGFVGRKGWKSLFRDTWKIFDPKKIEIGTVEEEGGIISILRRLVDWMKFVPKKFHFNHDGVEFALASQKFQLIGDTWTLTISQSNVDTRLIVTAALMMDIVEQQRGG